MARLQAHNTAGFNAGNNFLSKMILLSDIVIDPEIAGIFTISDETLGEIKERIKNFGYNKEEPVVIWKGRNILVDGRTRYTAAKEAGLEEIPAVEREFANREEAIFYTIERQTLRRNLKAAEILRVVKLLPTERNRKGEGRLAEHLAKMLGKSASTVYKAKKITEDATPEILEKVENGEMSIKEGYQETVGTKNKNTEAPVEFSVTDAHGLPDNVKFLKGAVTLLLESNKLASAKLLVNHYLKKNERDGFYRLLPGSLTKKPAAASFLDGSMSNRLGSNVLTAHAKIGAACDFIAEWNCIGKTEEMIKPLDLLKEAMECLETVENCLAVLE